MSKTGVGTQQRSSVVGLQPEVSRPGNTKICAYFTELSGFRQNLVIQLDLQVTTVDFIGGSSTVDIIQGYLLSVILVNDPLRRH